MSVAKWGVGNPDYHKASTASRSVVSEVRRATTEISQRPWKSLYEGDVSAESSVSTVIYTVPTGWRLYMGGGFVTCDASCLQKVRLVVTPGILGDFWFDVRGDIILSEPATMTFEPGTVMTLYVFNYDTATRRFTVSLVGTEEKIA